MKTYAVFLFDDDKQGMERYTFQKNIELAGDQEVIEQTARVLYVDYLVEEGNFVEIPKTIKATTLDMRVTINGVKFASQTTALIPRNGGKAIVLAERIVK